MEWAPGTGEYRVWRYQRFANAALFFAEPEVVGSGITIRTGHEMVYLGRPPVVCASSRP